MNNSKSVLAAIVITAMCGALGCKRSSPPPDSVNAPEASTSEVKAAPPEDKSPQYVKDLRKDMQKARDVGAVEQKSAEDEKKATDDATK